MLSYQYRAAAADGTLVSGVELAETRADVVSRLQALGHVPIWIDEARSVRSPRRFKLPRLGRARSRRQRVGDVTRGLATLLRAGMPLDRALAVLSSLEGESGLADELNAVRRSIKSGTSFADALAGQAQVFTPFYVSMVRSGESTGALEAVLDRLAEHLASSREIRESVTSALIYPAVLVVVACISIFVLLGYVVPQFAEMFEGSGQTLPLSTRITVGVGEIVAAYGWVGLLIIGGVWLWMRRWLSEPGNLTRWHAWLLRLPLIGSALLKAEAAQFARTLATLLKNGVSLLRALSIAADTLGNRALAEGVARVAQGVRQGQRFADPLAAETDFPELAVQMIRIGEESGKLNEVLEHVADTYERETQTAIKRTLAVLEPGLILILGGVIAAVIMSILAAVLSLNELVI